MNRKLSVGVSIALIFVAITITFSGSMIFAMRLFDEKVQNVQERAAMYSKLMEIDNIVRSNIYFKIDEDRLSDAISRGYLAGIGDKDAVYLSPSQLQRRQELSKGYEVTVGFELEENVNGYGTVKELSRFSSAYSQGLIEGDVVIKIDNQDILEIGFQEAVKLIPGIAGTKLAIVFIRDGEELTIEITREQIESTVVFAVKSIPDLGYIRIRTFNDNTGKQFASVLGDLLNRDPVKGLIIDLRNTSGGYDLDMVARMLDSLLPTGVIVSGTFSDNNTKILYTSDDKSAGVPIIVLINENTSGYAELFAGVVGDNANCATVGLPTAGKGTLQQISKLTDGSALELTVAILNLPLSGQFDGIGVKPDYEVTNNWYSFSDEEINPVNDSQLAKAVEVIRTMVK